MNLDELCRCVSERFEALSRYLYPNGRKEGHRLLVGSCNGELGRSFDINLRTQFFGDWATDNKKQRGGINLWMVARDVDFKTAVQEIAAWLGCQVDVPGNGHQETGTGDKVKRILFPAGMALPREQDLQVLSQSRAIGIDALRIAAERGFIYCFDDQLNGRCWLYTDQRRRCGLRRRLDNQLFQLANGSASKSPACYGSDMKAPIGYQEAALYPCFGVAEGGTNSLSILAHASASGVERRVAPVCMPSTSADFNDLALAYLHNKRARIFIDDDGPGQQAAERWAAQLKSANVMVDGFSFSGLIMIDGRPVQDLNNLLEISYDCWEGSHEKVENIMNFAL
jgi:hypothetical protein